MKSHYGRKGYSGAYGGKGRKGGKLVAGPSPYKSSGRTTEKKLPRRASRPSAG